MVGLYWSKTGSWYEVDAGLEASAFVDGVPSVAQALRLVVSGEEAGFVSAGGRLGRSRAVPVDVVVNCCHGGPGENGTLQAAFDLAGVAYTGPGVAAAALGMDKLAFFGVARAAGLPVLPRAVLSADHVDRVDFEGPYIVKPRFGGSSIGVEVVADRATAAGAAARQRPPAQRRGDRALSRRPVRLQPRPPHVARRFGFCHRASRAGQPERRDPRLRG